MVFQIIKQIVVAVALAGAVGVVAADTATATATASTGATGYTFLDLSGSITIADATFTTTNGGIAMTFNEGGNFDALLTNATSLTVNYKKKNSSTVSSDTFSLTPGYGDTLDRSFGGNGASFVSATLDYTYTPTTAVPEPESYAMLLAGLGLMGTIALRRNKNKAG